MLIWAVPLVLLAVIAFGVYYLCAAVKRPRLIYQANPDNVALIRRLPRLTRHYWPTPWLFNSHLQLLGSELKTALAPRLKYDRVDTLHMADGGTTALHWFGSALPAEVPTLVVLHGVTGSPQSTGDFVRNLHRLTGWRIVLCLRRGHDDLPLTRPRFGLLGDTGDLRKQLRCIQNSYPKSPLYAAGLSAGSGLLFRYLGEAGANTAIKGAFAYCPGYDISVAFARARQPYNRLFTQRVIDYFVTPHRRMLADFPTLARLENARNMDEFQRHAYECAGYADYPTYLEHCNPMGVVDGITTPLLVLNAEDDPLCVLDNVHEHESIIANHPGILLALTARGSHCAHLAGLTARPWAHHLAAEYLLALRADN